SEQREPLPSIRTKVGDLLLQHIRLEVGGQRVAQRRGVLVVDIVLAELDEVVAQLFVALLYLFLVLYLDRVYFVGEVDPHQLGQRTIDKATTVRRRQRGTGDGHLYPFLAIDGLLPRSSLLLFLFLAVDG